jgi:3-beta hydroxysteroid dehydrogenase/isomerase family.
MYEYLWTLLTHCVSTLFYFTSVQTLSKVLVLFSKHFCSGGSGFLGQHIVKLLQENDPKVREIRILDLKPYVNHLGKQTYL